MKIRNYMLAFLLTASAWAETPKEAVFVISPGMRVVSIEEQKELEEDYRNEEENHPLEDEVQLARSFNYAVDYTLYGLRMKGYLSGTLMLTDGSLWIVKMSDAWVANNWNAYNTTNDMATDYVYITSNEGWIYNNDYPFRLVHWQTGQWVQAFLSQSPEPAETRWINFIDYDRRYVEVADMYGNFTSWSLSYWDHKISSKWQVGDRILIGRNTRWNASSNPYILINVETYNYARGDLCY